MHRMELITLVVRLLIRIIIISLSRNLILVGVKVRLFFRLLIDCGFSVF